VDRGQARRFARWLFLSACAAALFGCIDFVYQLPAPAGYGAQFIWLRSECTAGRKECFTTPAHLGISAPSSCH